MRDNALDVTVGELPQQTPTLTTAQSLERALGVLVRSDAPGLPVLDGGGREVVGWLTHRAVLRLYHARLEHGMTRAQHRGDGGERRLPESSGGATG